MKYLIRQTALACATALVLSALPTTARAEFSWEAAIEQLLNDLLHAPIPDAIAPLVTIAENSDELGVDLLTIALAQKRKQLFQDSLFPPDDATGHQIEKDIKAIEQLIAKSREIKDKIAPPHKEQGLDPFFGRMVATGPVSLPAVGQNITVNLQLDTSTANELGPETYLVLPGPTGATMQTVIPSAASASIGIVNEGAAGRLKLNLNSFSYTVPSFQLAGAATGPTTLELSTAIGAPLGVLNSNGSSAGTFTLRFGAKMTNALYGPGGTLGGAIPVLVQAHGAFDPATGKAIITAEDPLMLPGLPGYTPNAPMLVAPTMAHFDSATGDVSFHDMFFDAEAGLDSGQGPKVLMFRGSNNQYSTIFDATDPLVGATLSIGPLHITSQTGAEVDFSDSVLTLQDAGGILLRANLTGISLITATGQFEGLLDITAPGTLVDAARSPFLQDWLTGNRRFQFLSPQAAGELYLASASFTQNAQSTMPDFVNGGSTIPEPASVALVMAGLLVIGARVKRPI